MLLSVLHPVSDAGAISQISRCGIPKATQRRGERKETRTQRGEIAVCLLASALASRAVISVSPRPRAPPARWGHEESEALLAGPVTAAHRFACFAFCLKKKKGASQESTATGCHTVSRPACLFTRVHLHFSALREYTYHFFPPKLCTSMLFFEREPAGKNISVQLWSEWQDVPRAWCMLNSRCCTLYLPTTFWALYTWLILYRWHTAFLDLSGDGSSGCSPSQLHISMSFLPLPSRLIWRCHLFHLRNSKKLIGGPEVDTSAWTGRKLICEKSIKRPKASREGWN